MTAPLSPRQEIWRGLLLGQRSMLTTMAAELKREFGLSVPAFEALLSLWEAPERSMQATRLARTLLYSSGSASNLVTRLVEAGLVRREPGVEDARVIQVALTERGSELIERAVAVHLASIAREFEPLIDDADVQPLLAFTRRLAAHEDVVSAPFA
ncbi:MarR family transcriptional regulator [Streptomyces sp. NPDC047973]|uniref:MarR family winged helix-turn-helix transcriptional regulator n=1 Tax=Streptomyces sp. NPDC047973 TaxID=3155383 RepID=UPI0034216206